MSAGTIALTNNSTTVIGTGTAFTTELKAGDFIGVTVGGAPYTLVVLSIATNTQLTLSIAYNGPTTSALAWYAVPATLQVAITQKILNDMATVARGMILDKANWQAVYSSSGNITVMLPDGSTFTGPSWKSIVDQIAANTTAIGNKAAKGANSDITSLSGLTTALSIQQGGTGATTAAAARAALGLGTAAVAAVGTGTGQIPDMSSFTSSKASNGWQRLPGGLIIQWASFVPGAASGAFNPSFPIAFPTGTLQLTMSVYDDFDSHAIVWRRTSNNQLTNWQVGLFGGNAYLSVEMIAIGY